MISNLTDELVGFGYLFSTGRRPAGWLRDADPSLRFDIGPCHICGLLQYDEQRGKNTLGSSNGKVNHNTRSTIFRFAT
jgi:hypothetical protein